MENKKYHTVGTVINSDGKQKYHTVGTVINSDGKIPHCRNSYKF
jgi:hypothetical protein